MSHFEDNAKVQPEPSTPYRNATLFVALIIGLQILVALISYPFLPNEVPSHWNAAGQITSYSPKWIMALLFPVLSLGVYVLVRGLIALGPALGAQGKQYQRTNQGVVNLILIAVMLVEFIVQVTTIAAALKFAVDITFVMSIVLSLMFIFIGNYLGKLRRNFWAGIRTPWTLSSETVWERTHRLGGHLFVIGGVLGLATALIPSLRLWGILGIVIAIALITVVYSYVIYQRIGNADL